MIEIATELFAVNDLTVAVTVPTYWSDASVWADGEDHAETTTVRGIFRTPYEDLGLGTAGQESADPVVQLLTSDVPNAREGDLVTVNSTNYKVGTPKPDGNGVTEIDLMEYTPNTSDVVISNTGLEFLDGQTALRTAQVALGAVYTYATPADGDFEIYWSIGRQQWEAELPDGAVNISDVLWVNPSHDSTQVPLTGWLIAGSYPGETLRRLVLSWSD